MKRNYYCNDCLFFKKNGFQDMGASSDICEIFENQELYSGFLDNEPSQFCKQNCKYFLDKHTFIKLFKLLIDKKEV